MWGAGRWKWLQAEGGSSVVEVEGSPPSLLFLPHHFPSLEAHPVFLETLAR